MEVLQDFPVLPVLFVLAGTVCTSAGLVVSNRSPQECLWLVTVTTPPWLAPRVLRCLRTDGFAAPTVPEHNVVLYKLWKRRDREHCAVHLEHPPITSLDTQPSLSDGSRAAHVKITITDIPNRRNYRVVSQYIHYLHM